MCNQTENAGKRNPVNGTYTTVTKITKCLTSDTSFQPVVHDWCNKGCGMCYPVSGMMQIKQPLQIIGKVAYVAAEGFLSRYLSGLLPYV